MGDSTKILVVDDDVDTLAVLVAMLTKNLAGCEVASASSGQDGVETARTLAPDAILLDIVMPEMDGFEVCLALKDDPATRHIPVIFLTGESGDSASRIRALEVGGDAFLTKPVQTAELIAQVRAMFRIKRAEDVLRGDKYVLEHDLSERTATLEKSEERFRTIFDSNSSAMAIIERDTTISMVNREYCRLSLYEEKDIVGTSWTSHIPPEDLERLLEYNRQRLIDPEGAPNQYEFMFYRKDGTIRNCLMSVTTIPTSRQIVCSFIDITERKRAEEDLGASHNLVEGIINSIPARVFWKNRESIFLGCNTLFARDAGLAEADDVIGKSDGDMPWREQAELYRGDDRHVVETGCAKLNIEEPQTTPDGKTIILLTNKAPLRAPDGEVSGVLGTYVDITERKLMETKVNSQLDELRRLHDVMLGRVGRVQELKREVNELCRGAGEPVRYPSQEAGPVNQATVLRQTDEQLNSEIVRSRGVEDELRHGLDQADRVHRALLSALEDQKLAEEALQESERHYRDLVEHALIGVYKSTPDGRILLANRELLRMLGFQSLEEMASWNLDWAAAEGKFDRAGFISAMERDGKVVGFESAWTRLDGSSIPVRENARAVRDHRGEIEYFEGTAEDLTRVKAVEMQLMHVTRMEAVDRLAGGIAHDFNNLLQAVLSGLALVRDDGPDPDRLAELEDRVRSGGALARQLLLFTRQEISQLEPHDLNRVVGDTVDLVRRLLPSGVALTLELDSDELPVLNDRGQLEQVLLNLSGNATDAMADGGRLVLRSGRAGDDEVWFEVEDSGCGMSEEVRARLFEPFFTTKELGSGLGLAVVHGVVKQACGRVEVASEIGRGSRFRVILPRGPALGSPPETHPASTSASARGRGKRILVVEDDDSVRLAIKATLTRLGYQVIAVDSGEAALALPADKPFAILLTDMILGGITGAEVAANLQQRWPDLAVVIMSGYTENADVRAGVREGRVNFLAKPFGMDVLAREIERALTSSRSGAPPPGSPGAPADHAS